MMRYFTNRWLIEVTGSHPVERDLGRSVYGGIEFPHETAWTRSPEPLSPESDALRLAR